MPGAPVLDPTLALVAPITTGGNFARLNGFTVPLLGDTKVRGIVLTNQIRMVDYRERQCKIIETCPDYILYDVLAKVQALVDF
jgi:mRNA interferase ChpB